MKNNTKNANKTTRKQVSIHTASVMVIAVLQLSLQGGPPICKHKAPTPGLERIHVVPAAIPARLKNKRGGWATGLGGTQPPPPFADTRLVVPSFTQLPPTFVPSFLPSRGQGQIKQGKKGRKRRNKRALLFFHSPYSLHDISPASSPPPMHHLPDTSLKVSLRSGQEAFQGLAMTVVGAVGDVWV